MLIPDEYDDLIRRLVRQEFHEKHLQELRIRAVHPADHPDAVRAHLETEPVRALLRLIDPLEAERCAA